MAVKIKVGDKSFPNQTSFTVSESSTPIDITDTSGGVGQVSFGTIARPGWRSLRKKLLSLVDPSQGKIQGIVSGLENADGALTITADARTIQMTARRQAQPFVGTLGNAIRYYLSLVGITSAMVIDDTLENVPVTIAGFEDEIYLFIAKKLCPAMKMEMSLVSNNIVFRPYRGRTAVNYRNASVTESISEGDVAQAIEITQYASTVRNNALVYPVGGWNEDVEIFQVDAGATVVYEDVPVSASLTSVQQPVPVLRVDRYFNSSSVYAVAGNDGLPITPEQWTAQGGSLKVEINEDTRSLKITIKGASLEQYAPYQIAMSSGSSNNYSSLRLVGSGIFLEETVVSLPTGLTEDEAPTEVGAQVYNEAIQTLEQLFDLGIWSMARWKGPRKALSVNTSGINRIGETGSYQYPLVSEFNQANAGKTIAQFNQEWAGKSIADFNAYWASTVADTFANQAFGNVAGARVVHEDEIYRIRSASIGANVSYSADPDTTVGDFDIAWTGYSIEEFNAFWDGLTIADFNVRPLGSTGERREVFHLTPSGTGAYLPDGLPATGDGAYLPGRLTSNGSGAYYP